MASMDQVNEELKEHCEKEAYQEKPKYDPEQRFIALRNEVSALLNLSRTDVENRTQILVDLDIAALRLACVCRLLYQTPQAPQCS